MNFLTRLSLERPAATLIFLAMVTLALGVQLTGLTSETGYRAYLGEEHPAVLELDSFIAGFGGGLPMGAVWACDEGSPCTSVFDAEALEMASSVVAALRETPNVRRVESPATSQLLVARNDTLEAYRLGEVRADSDELRWLSERALQDPLWRGTLVSDDARVGAIVVELASSDSDAAYGVLLDLQAALAPYEARGFTYHLVGQTAQFALTDAALAADSARLTPVMIALVALVMWVLFQSWQAVLASLATVGLATLWTLGIMATMEWPQNSITQTIAPLILVMALSSSVHLLSRYGRAREALAAEARPDRERAMLRAAREAGPPCLVTTLTTAAGFASFATSNLESFLRFGLTCAGGITASLVLTFLVLPMAMTRLPPDRVQSARASRQWQRALAALVEGTRRHARAIVVSSLALCAVFSLGMSMLRVDIDEYKLYGEESDVVRGFRFLERHLRQPDTLEIEIRLPKNGQLYAKETLTALHDLSHSIEEVDGLGPVHSVLDSLAWTNRLLNGDDPSYDRLGLTSGENAELLTVLSLKDPMALDRWMSPNFQRVRLSVEARKMPQSDRGAVLDAVLERIASHLGDTYDAKLTGSFAVYYDLTVDIQRTQLASFGTAVGVVLLLLAVYLRTMGGSTAQAFGWACVGMFPTILPVVVVFGVMGFASIDLDMGTAMVAAILIGIGVDDTIHLLSEFYRRRLAGEGAASAIQSGVLHVGQAVLTTSAALSLGFMVLTLSSWQSIASFGFLSGIAIFGALAADLWVLPALILWLGPQSDALVEEEAEAAPEVPPDRKNRIALTMAVLGALGVQFLIAVLGIPPNLPTRVLACRTMPNGVVPVVASASEACNLESLDRVIELRQAGEFVPATERAAFLDAVSGSRESVTLLVERGGELIEASVPTKLLTSAAARANLLAAFSLVVAAMTIAIRVYWHSKSRAAPALLLLFGAVCAEVTSIICGAHGDALQWASAPVAPLIAASLMHLALTFPRERPILRTLPGLVWLPYILAALLGVIELRGLHFDPSFWRLCVLFMLAFATGGALLLGVNSLRAARWAQAPLERTRGRLLAVSFCGVPLILGSAIFGLGQGLPGGQLSPMLLGIAIFVLPLGYSITRYQLFDLPERARTTLDRGLELLLIGTLCASFIAASSYWGGEAGPLVWSVAAAASAICARALTVRARRVVQLGASGALRRGLLETHRHEAPFAISQDASAQLAGRTIEAGLRVSGVAIFVVAKHGWRPAYANGESPAFQQPFAAAAAGVLEQETPFASEPIRLALGDVRPTPAVAQLRSAGVTLVIPIHSGQVSLGLILISSPAGHTFTAEETRFAGEIARHTASALAVASEASERLAGSQRNAWARYASETAHELGGPLRVIERRAARMAERPDDPDFVIDEARRVAALSRQMLSTVYDAAEQAVSHRDAVAPSSSATVEETLARVKERLGEAHGREEIHLSLSPDLPLIPEPDAIAHALLNLIDNALQASASGQPVWIYATQENETVRIEVRDTGRGMDENTLAEAFSPGFSTSEGSSMGMGLVLARDIIENMGGKVELESAPSAGTTATVRIPAFRATEAAC